jgi:hypothetical protein
MVLVAVFILIQPPNSVAEEPSREAPFTKSDSQCVAADLLVSQGLPANGVGHYYYGGVEWPEMTSAIDVGAATVTVTADLENLAQMLQYDALWIDQRDMDGSLTETEEDNVAAFIATGRRVVMIGENPWWADWNQQILDLVGGTFVGENTTWTLYTAAAHELTQGVSSIYVNAGGYCTGGTALFDWNVATVWSDSVLTLLDVSFMSTDYWDSNHNQEFSQNIAQWIGCKEALFADGFESGNTTAWSGTVP